MQKYIVNPGNDVSISVNGDDILQLYSAGAVQIRNANYSNDVASFVMRGRLSWMKFSESRTILVRAADSEVEVGIISMSATEGPIDAPVVEGLSVIVSASNSQGSVSRQSEGAQVAESYSDIRTIFANGEKGMVFLPGTEWTDCYEEGVGTPNTLCTNGSRVGTIHDKVRNTYTRIPVDNDRPLYIVDESGRHAVISTRPENHIPLTDGPVAATSVDFAMALNLNGDTTGILMTSGDANGGVAADTYLGVYAQNASGGISDAMGQPVTQEIVIDGEAFTGAHRGDLYSALAGGNHIVEMKAVASFPNTPWQIGRYVNGYAALDFNSQYIVYGIIVRFDAPLNESERALRSSIIEEQV